MAAAIDGRRTVIAMMLNPVAGPWWAFLVPVAGVAGLIVGFLWMRHIVGRDPDDEPSFWRYREIDDIRKSDRRKGLPTFGWIATRLTMAFAIGVFAVVIASPFLGLAGTGTMLQVGDWLWLSAVALSGAGTVWIFRIAYRGPEHGARPSWRYRDR